MVVQLSRRLQLKNIPTSVCDKECYRQRATVCNFGSGLVCSIVDRTEATLQQQFARFARDFVDPG